MHYIDLLPFLSNCGFKIQVKDYLPISLFLCAFIEAYLTVPLNPAAPLGGLTSP